MDTSVDDTQAESAIEVELQLDTNTKTPVATGAVTKTSADNGEVTKTSTETETPTVVVDIPQPTPTATTTPVEQPVVEDEKSVSSPQAKKPEVKNSNNESNHLKYRIEQAVINAKKPQEP